jgi:hypothetical protein
MYDHFSTPAIGRAPSWSPLRRYARRICDQSHRRGETVSTIGQLRAQLANLQGQIDEAKARTRAEGLQKIKAIMTIAGLTAPTKKRGPKAGRSLRNCGYQKLWGLARACLRETK